MILQISAFMKIQILYFFLQKHPQYSLIFQSLQKLKTQIRESFDYQSISDFLRFHHSEFWQDYTVAEMRLSSFFREILHRVKDLEKEKISVICFGESEYPISLYCLEDPPLVLYYKGCLACLSFPSLAVVGSREPQDKSLNWMEDTLLSSLQKNPITVVSGGARGVDQKAHSLSLRTSSPTAVVVPSGLSAIYPSTLNEWIDEIIKNQGCVISEYEPNQVMHKYLFHQRNRLIAALSTRVIIVEGKKKSGTLLTAHLALNLGKEIAVVPAHPLESAYSGNLALLQDGAYPLTDSQQLDQFLKGCVNTKNEGL